MWRSSRSGTKAKSVRPAVLVIVGTDSSGGAGLIRDVRVLTDFEIDVLCAITAVTAQSNSRVTAVHHVPPEVIRAQIVAAFETRPVGGIKIGMLGNRTTVEAVVESLPSGTAVPIVLDPVLVASSGGILLDADGRAAMRERLFPRATIVIPNVPEAAMLLGEDPATGELALIAQAQRLLALGPQAVLLKGGHAGGEEAVDLLISGNNVVQRIASARVRAIHRGTGCALASAITAALVSGTPLVEACHKAKRYVVDMLSHAE
jgi:hydroxymethylpyrimidine/phosphomethylpyrimidine kinase